MKIQARHAQKETAQHTTVFCPRYGLPDINDRLDFHGEGGGFQTNEVMGKEQIPDCK